MSVTEPPIEFQNISLNSRAINDLKSEVVQARKNYELLRSSNLEKIEPKKALIEESLINLFKSQGYKEILLNRDLSKNYYKSHQVGSYNNFNSYLSALFENDHKNFSFSQRRITAKNSDGNRLIFLEVFLDCSKDIHISIENLKSVALTVNSVFEVIKDSLGVESYEKSFLNVRGNFLKRVGRQWEFVDSETSSVWGLVESVESSDPVESLLTKLLISLSVKM